MDSTHVSNSNGVVEKRYLIGLYTEPDEQNVFRIDKYIHGENKTCKKIKTMVVEGKLLLYKLPDVVLGTTGIMSGKFLNLKLKTNYF